MQLLACDAVDIASLCSPSPSECGAAVEKVCIPSHPLPSDDVLAECRACALGIANVNTMRDARCNASFVNAACIADAPGGGDMFDNEWIQNIMDMGCHMNGTWYV